MTSIPSIRHCKVPCSSLNVECLKEENRKPCTLPHTPVTILLPTKAHGLEKIHSFVGICIPKMEVLARALLCFKWDHCRLMLELTLHVLEYGS